MTNNTARLLTECCLQAPSADNHQPFLYRFRDGVLTCSYDHKRVTGKTFEEHDPATLISAGAALENLMRYASDIDLNVQVETLLTQENSYFKVQLSDTEDALDSSNKDGLHPIFQRHTNRHPYINSEEVSSKLKKVSLGSQLAVEAGCVSQQQDIVDIAQLVKRASVIRFCTKEVHEWLGKSIRYSKNRDEKLDGLDIDTLALPPGGSLFMKLIGSWKRMSILNRIGMSRVLANIDSQPVSAAPTLITFIAENTKAGAMNAGRRLAQVWTELNEQGLAVQPYYVISDLTQRLSTGGVPENLESEALSIIEDTNQKLSISANERLYMILRVGIAKKEATRSLRLPLSTVYKEE